MKRPYCAVHLKLERSGHFGRSIAIGQVTPELLGALDRLFELRRTKDIPVLASLIQLEIIYRLLTSEQGNRLRELSANMDRTVFPSLAFSRSALSGLK